MMGKMLKESWEISMATSTFGEGYSVSLTGLWRQTIVIQKIFE